MPNTKFLNGTRFLLSMWVFIGHFYLYAGGKDFLTLPIIGDVLLSPAIAVDGFILITGFLMMYTYSRRSEKESPALKSTQTNFWIRRFFRLYPVYILFVIISFFIKSDRIGLLANMTEFYSGVSSVVALGVTTAPPTLANLFSHIFLLQGLIPSHTSSINGVTWSLSLEAQFYALFPFIFLWLFGTKNNAKNRLFLSFVVSIILGLISTRIGSQLGYFYPSVLIDKLPFFLLGMILASVSLKKMNFGYLGLVVILLAPFLNTLQSLSIGFIILFVNLSYLNDYLPASAFNLLSKCNNLLSNRFSEFGANISYSLYLSHSAIIVYVNSWIVSLDLDLSKYLIAAISLSVSLAFTFVSSHFIFKWIEQPFILLGNKIVGKLNTEANQSSISA